MKTKKLLYILTILIALFTLNLSVNAVEDTSAENKGNTIIVKNETSETTGCKAVFQGDAGDKLLDFLRKGVVIVKIAIPIMLLGLGVLDFSKAVFSGSEDTMKKTQAKFIKRVIIAMCIFLIPTVIKVTLTIGHEIWPNISPDFCGILK